MRKILPAIKRNIHGFTFLEVIIAVAIFAIIMVAVSGIFGKSFKSYRGTQAIQKDMENAQFALNLMAKTVRTSKIIVPSVTNTVLAIRIYDYSQLSNKCIEYKFENNKLKSGASNIADADEMLCTSTTSIVLSDMTTETITGSFSVVPSSPTVIGRVTISAEVCPPGGCSGAEKDRARVQTTVSLLQGMPTPPALDQVATPYADPSGENFSTSLDIRLYCITTGATIHYTIDGSNPTTSSATYNSAIHITDSKIIKAFAVKTGMLDSEIMTEKYTYNFIEPPPAGPTCADRCSAIGLSSVYNGIYACCDGMCSTMPCSGVNYGCSQYVDPGCSACGSKYSRCCCK